MIHVQIIDTIICNDSLEPDDTIMCSCFIHMFLDTLFIVDSFPFNVSINSR